MRYRVALLLACVFALGCSHGPEGVPRVEKRLLASIPIGSSSRQVLQYLDSQGIRHTPYQPAQRGDVTASLPDATNASRFAIIKIDYALDLKFDRADRLTSLKVTQHLTGP